MAAEHMYTKKNKTIPKKKKKKAPKYYNKYRKGSHQRWFFLNKWVAYYNFKKAVETFQEFNTVPFFLIFNDFIQVLKRIEVCSILYPLHVFYLTSCPQENSLDRPFSVIQSASVASSILHWNSPVHPPLLSIPPTCHLHAGALIMPTVSPSISLITLHWSTHYCLSVSHFSAFRTLSSFILISV